MANVPQDFSKKPGQLVPQTSGKAIFSLVLGLLSFFCVFFTGIPAIILGILGLSDIRKSRGGKTGDALAIIGIVTGVMGCLWTMISVALLLPAVHQVRGAARQTQAQNNMRLMALGMLNHESAYRQFPIASPNPEDPNPDSSQLSWRVQVLPFMDEYQLYEEFHHNEPWDSPHNLTLVGRMPPVFECLSHPLEPGKTMYVVPTTPIDENGQPDMAHRTIFVPGQGATFGAIQDGSSNTILILEVDPESAVVWTKPEDWELDLDDPKRSLGNVRRGKFLAAFADGSLHKIPADLPPETIKALMTAAGGEQIPQMAW